MLSGFASFYAALLTATADFLTSSAGLPIMACLCFLPIVSLFSRLLRI